MTTVHGAPRPDGPAEPPVVRLHLRSTLEHVDHHAQEEFCLAGYAGMGWGCWDDTPTGTTWDEYETRKDAAGEGISESVRRLHALPMGSLVWTRRLDGSYWLGEIVGEWEYRGDQVARDLDLFNLRRCRWWPVGAEDAVPGKIVNNFRATVTLNPVGDPAAIRYTRQLHAQLTGAPQNVEPPDPREVIESLLGAEALEDLVAVFLQDRFELLLVARGRATPGYEYVLRNRRTGRRAVASVKSGGAAVDLDRLPEHPDIDAFAYAVSGVYTGRPRPDVRRIETAELVRFMLDRKAVLPDQVARWLA